MGTSSHPSPESTSAPAPQGHMSIMGNCSVLWKRASAFPGSGIHLCRGDRQPWSPPQDPHIYPTALPISQPLPISWKFWNPGGKWREGDQEQDLDGGVITPGRCLLPGGGEIQPFQKGAPNLRGEGDPCSEISSLLMGDSLSGGHPRLRRESHPQEPPFDGESQSCLWTIQTEKHRQDMAPP